METDENNYAFIDSQNLNLGMHELGWKLDYEKFRVYLKEKYHTKKAYVFVGFIEANQGLYNRLTETGFELKFKPTVMDGNGKIKGNIDADMVLSVMVDWDNYNKAIIISSDGDFYSLVEYLYKNDKLKTVLTTNQEKCSKLLKEKAQEKINFIADLQEKLAYKKKSTA